MKRLKTYRIFESETGGLKQIQKIFLNRSTMGRWSLDEKTGMISVDGTFNCSNKDLEDFIGLKFEDAWDFYCSDNKLESLVGCPESVQNDFVCNGNRLKNLIGGPKEVGQDFYCLENPLESLEGAPKSIGWKFVCDVFEIRRGGWNETGWLQILKFGLPDAQKLIMTILPIEALNQEIVKDKDNMIQCLSQIWDEEWFQKYKDGIKLPEEIRDVDKFMGSLRRMKNREGLI